MYGMKTMRQSGADRRLSLMQAALDLFSTQGYDGTTTKAIAARSGVTEGLLFKHFHTKQELLSEVVTAFGPERVFLPLPVEVRALPIRQALEQLITQYLDAFWLNRAFMRMVFTTPKRDQAPYENLWAEFGRQGMYLYAMLQESSDRGELKPGISAAATEIISTSTSGFLQRVLTDEPPDWESARAQYVANLLQTILHGVQS